MDLGIRGRKAIVCAPSRGLGKACATALAREGCSFVINGFDRARRERAATAIRKATGAKVTPMRADINTEQGRAALIAACSDADILVNNNAGPPPGRFDDWKRADWQAAIDANMLAPILMIQALLPGMRARKFGRIVNVTSAMVKSPHSHMGLSTSCRAALTALCKAISRDVAVDNVTINNLLPERIDTDRQRFMAERMMKAEGITREEARRRQAAALPTKRLGLPEEFGHACAHLCSAQAGFISGQNLQLDGRSYQGLL